MSRLLTIIKGDGKMKRIETPKMSEILKEEFMDPLNISSYKLSKDIKVPVSRIQDILHDRRKITVDTSLRLGAYFGVSDRYFLNLQNDIDIREAKKEIGKEIIRIRPVSDSAFQE
jgi:addiction module HigA family antidote